MPLYSFGHGLSYTQFIYSNLKLSSQSLEASGTIDVSFDLRNVGDREGADVAQLYTHQRQSSVIQPIESLRAFERVYLRPGETRHVQMEVPISDLAFSDLHTHGFRVEPAQFDIMIGSASDDIRLLSYFEVRN